MKILKTFFLFAIITVLFSQIEEAPKPITRDFIPAGSIEAALEQNSSSKLLLVQLDLKNDSLFTLVDQALPNLELYSGPASYHRILYPKHLDKIESVITSEFFNVINDNYTLLNSSRDFWIDVKQGSETQGVFSDDEAIEYTCACLTGASDCVKLGWDESWYNPFDYWGEAWYGYEPPNYQSIDEIRVVVRGGQCDELPFWSETYMGMMDNSGNWSQDYELSIEYTDNEFIVGNIWNGTMLMPRIGSEDNYCIDSIRLKFYYTCDEPLSVESLSATNGESCTNVDISWDITSSDIESLILYRDNTEIAQLGTSQSSYQDWGATSDQNHLYCIEVLNECGASEKVCNIGSLKSAPSSPGNVIASDGSFSNIVNVNWLSSDDTTEEYRIYRDGSWMGFVAPNILEYTDYIPEMDQVYNYCIEAINDCGQSNWNCDYGYIQEPGGDINLDGNIDVLDVITIMNIILATYEPSLEELSLSDLNNDTFINILDIVIITNTILNQ